jgi:hypothetical protein
MRDRHLLPLAAPSACQLRGREEGLAVARIRSGDDHSISLDPEVVLDVSANSPTWPFEVARAASGFDLVWIQHEFGIFGPGRGRRLLDLCEVLERPVVSTLHTVLLEPTRMEREIIEGLSSRSQRVVVMSQAARERLLSTHEVDPGKLSVIQHGAHEYRASELAIETHARSSPPGACSARVRESNGASGP